MNPFGIEHEPLSKAYNKIAPKLARAAREMPWGPGMPERMRQNYTVARIQMAEDKNPANAQRYKEFRNASMKGYRNAKKNRRVLP